MTEPTTPVPDDIPNTTTPAPSEGYTWFVERAKAVKEGQVALYDGTDRTTDDITPAVYVEVQHPFPVSVVAIAPAIDRDMGLSIAHILATALRPEWISFMADAHTANVPENPATGKPWGPGEMQNACDVEGACSVGMLDDCLMFTTVWRDSERARTDTQVYTVTKGEGVGASTMRWEGYGPSRTLDSEGLGDASLGGLVPDTLRQSLRDDRAQRMFQVMSEAMGLDENATFAHTVVGAIRALGAQGVAAMVMTEDPFLLQRLQEANGEEVPE